MKKRSFSLALVASAFSLIGVGSMVSCSSDSSSDETSEVLNSQPLVVTEEEFAAARYVYQFATTNGNLVSITPSQGGVVGGEIPGVMSIIGTNISVNVMLRYALVENLLTPDIEEDDFEAGTIAHGTMEVSFIEETGAPIEFFEALGVIFATEEDEEAELPIEHSLPVGSSFTIQMNFVDSVNSDQVALVTALDPLASLVVSWVRRGSDIPIDDAAFELWLEGEMFTGPYTIIRNQ